MDLSKLSDEDLKLMAAGDVKSMSTEGLQLMAGVQPKAATKTADTRHYAERHDERGNADLVQYLKDLPGNIKDVGTSLQEGVSFGNRAKLVALDRSINDSIRNKLTPGAPNTGLMDKYDEFKAEERAKDTAREERSPVISTAGSFVGSAVPFIASGGTSIPAMIAGGAAAGGAYGFGKSDADTLGGSLADTGTGAALGGALGGALPVAAKLAIPSVAKAVAQDILPSISSGAKKAVSELGEWYSGGIGNAILNKFLPDVLGKSSGVSSGAMGKGAIKLGLDSAIAPGVGDAVAGTVAATKGLLTSGKQIGKTYNTAVKTAAVEGNQPLWQTLMDKLSASGATAAEKASAARSSFVDQQTAKIAAEEAVDAPAKQLAAEETVKKLAEEEAAKLAALEARKKEMTDAIRARGKLPPIEGKVEQTFPIRDGEGGFVRPKASSSQSIMQLDEPDFLTAVRSEQKRKADLYSPATKEERAAIRNTDAEKDPDKVAQMLEVRKSLGRDPAEIGAARNRQQEIAAENAWPEETLADLLVEKSAATDLTQIREIQRKINKVEKIIAEKNGPDVMGLQTEVTLPTRNKYKGTVNPVTGEITPIGGFPAKATEGVGRKVGKTIEYRDATGKLHREDGPAVSGRTVGGDEYWQEGKLNSDTGPAYLDQNGNPAYYQKGNKVANRDTIKQLEPEDVKIDPMDAISKEDLMNTLRMSPDEIRQMSRRKALEEMANNPPSIAEIKANRAAEYDAKHSKTPTTEGISIEELPIDEVTMKYGAPDEALPAVEHLPEVTELPGVINKDRFSRITQMINENNPHKAFADKKLSDNPVMKKAREEGVDAVDITSNDLTELGLEVTQRGNMTSAMRKIADDLESKLAEDPNNKLLQMQLFKFYREALR